MLYTFIIINTLQNVVSVGKKKQGKTIGYNEI